MTPSRWLLGASLLLLASCASPITPTIYQDSEDTLETGSDDTVIFHPAVYYPREVAMDFPGYLVGVEKSPVEALGGLAVVEGQKKHPLPEMSLGMARITEKIGHDTKTHYISHVVRNRGQRFGDGNCLLYSAYRIASGQSEAKSMEHCQSPQPLARNMFEESWSALTLLQRELEREVDSGNYSHLMVVVMGWNTPQEEAVRNFNSIISNIHRAANPAPDTVGKKPQAQPPFRPLVVGVTWPSIWVSNWIPGVTKAVSFFNKKNDADEIGAGWLAALVDEIARPLAQRIPVVMIGHSFGARTSTTALCQSSILQRPGGSAPHRPIDLYIGLQGALSLHRLTTPGSGTDPGDLRGVFYLHQCRGAAKRMIFTASAGDSANDIVELVNEVYIGSGGAWNEACGGEQPQPGFNCLRANAEGNIQAATGNGHIDYVNADQLIATKAYLSGGGSHSDIYRKETGQFLWNLIKTIRR